jgi:hypothetical protein
MAIPDPYANEPTTELDEDLVRAYQEAKMAVKMWNEELERIKSKLQEALGDAHAGTVQGKKVVSYRPQDRYATSRLVRDNPDLAENFWSMQVERVFQVNAFAAQHPDIAEQYRIRAFVELG